MRKIAVVTVGRSDYGLSRSILRRIVAEPSLQLQLLVSGAHLQPEFGNTWIEIEADGKISGVIQAPEGPKGLRTIAASLLHGTPNGAGDGHRSEHS